MDGRVRLTINVLSQSLCNTTHSNPRPSDQKPEAPMEAMVVSGSWLCQIIQGAGLRPRTVQRFQTVLATAGIVHAVPPLRQETHSCRRGPILCLCRSLRHSADSGGPPTLLPPCRIVRRSDLPLLTSRRPSGISSSKAALLYYPSSPRVCMCIFFYSH